MSWTVVQLLISYLFEGGVGYIFIMTNKLILLYITVLPWKFTFNTQKSCYMTSLTAQKIPFKTSKMQLYFILKSIGKNTNSINYPKTLVGLGRCLEALVLFWTTNSLLKSYSADQTQTGPCVLCVLVWFLIIASRGRCFPHRPHQLGVCVLELKLSVFLPSSTRQWIVSTSVISREWMFETHPSGNGWYWLAGECQLALLIDIDYLKTTMEESSEKQSGFVSHSRSAQWRQTQLRQCIRLIQ